MCVNVCVYMCLCEHMFVWLRARVYAYDCVHATMKKSDNNGKVQLFIANRATLPYSRIWRIDENSKANKFKFKFIGLNDIHCH